MWVLSLRVIMNNPHGSLILSAQNIARKAALCSDELTSSHSKSEQDAWCGHGALAQSVARLVRIEKVTSSNLVGSTWDTQ